MKKDNNVYLDSYVIQKDMRIRLPKEILKIFNVSKGNSYMDIYVDVKNNQILLKPNTRMEGLNNEK